MPDGGARNHASGAFPELTPEKRLERMTEIASAYRVEADEAMRDYEALEIDALRMAEALDKIARPRPNKTFDPWARDVAREALGYVSTRVTDGVSYDDFMSWAVAQNG